MKDVAGLHDAALEHEMDVIRITEKITECRIKMCKNHDTEALKSVIPLLDELIREVDRYREWLERIYREKKREEAGWTAHPV